VIIAKFRGTVNGKVDTEKSTATLQPADLGSWLWQDVARTSIRRLRQKRNGCGVEFGDPHQYRRSP
jgi:hypothetical protein